MKKILITGSNGQLGSEIRALAASYPDFRFVYTDVDELDLTNRAAIQDLFDREHVDVCVNCAAYTAVDKAEDDRDLALLINATAVEYLARECAAHHIVLVHVSTDYVFDGTHHQPYVETDAPSPNSYYGLTKLAGEKAVQKYAETAIILRTAWLYSAFGNNFVKTMLRLGKERDSLEVVVDQIGTPTYAGDLAKAILDLVANDKIKNQKVELYHYSNEGVISWYDFAKAIMREAGVDCQVNAIESKDFPAKANRPFYSVLNKAKIKSAGGVEVPYWLDSLTKVIRQLKTGNL